MAEYPTPPGDSLSSIIAEFKALARRISELEKPSGTNIASLVAQVQAALVTLNARVIAATNSYLSSGTVSMTNISASGNVSATNLTASGTVNGVAALKSVGAYSTDVTALPGGRQTVWQHNSGVYGYAPSTSVKKTNVRPVDFTAKNVIDCTPSIFAYKAQIDIRDNPENEFYDPDYVVPDEVGLFAENLINNKLEAFVIFDSDGITPTGVDYANFGAVANLVAVRDLHERLARLEANQP